LQHSPQRTSLRKDTRASTSEHSAGISFLLPRLAEQRDARPPAEAAVRLALREGAVLVVRVVRRQAAVRLALPEVVEAVPVAPRPVERVRQEAEAQHVAEVVPQERARRVIEARHGVSAAVLVPVWASPPVAAAVALRVQRAG
jgi:hypothetical protein